MLSETARILASFPMAKPRDDINMYPKCLFRGFTINISSPSLS